jgi:hypothetical protein
LFLAIYPPVATSTCTALKTVPTINGVLGTSSNDAIVTVSSQLAGAKTGSTHTFQGLSHTAAGFSFPLAFSDANVLQSADINQLILCWLSPPVGDAGCLKALPAVREPVAAPQIASANAHYVDRLVVKAAAGLIELGMPFDLAVDVGGDGLPELQVIQRSEKSGPTTLPTTISRVDGNIVYLNVVPQFYGETRFQVIASYPDGGVASKDVTMAVNLPSEPPSEFHASVPISVVQLDYDNPSIRLAPWAVYANTLELYDSVPGLDEKVPRRVYLDAGYISYSIAPVADTPVVRLDPVNGIVYGLRPGTVTIIGQFGALIDKVLVTVSADVDH